MIRRKYLDDKKEKENTNKYKFQGQYARSIRWFDIEYDSLEEKFSTREPDFYNFFKMNIKGQDMKTNQVFVVIIGNAKITEKIDFHLRAPVLKYHQE